MAYLRRLPRFEFIGARSLAEVCALRDGASEDSMLLAGGTDAVLQLRRRERQPRRVIGLKGVGELNFVRRESDGGVTLGGMTTLRGLLAAPILADHYPVLGEAVAQIGGHELRNVATIGGNVAGALPCADLPPVLMTLDARVCLSSTQGERWVPLESFFPEHGRTTALAGETISQIRLPPAPRDAAGSYLKFHDRHSMDMTVIGVAAFVRADRDKTALADVRLAYANAAPTVFRARRAEAILQGCEMTEAGLDAIAEAACREASPRTSWRANGDYRRELIRSLTKRAIRQAWRKIAEPRGART